MPEYKVIIKETWFREVSISADSADEAADLALNDDCCETSVPGLEYSHTDSVSVYHSDDEFCEHPILVDGVEDGS